MTYNYVVTNQKPTTVTHALTASFTSADALNLLLIRSTRLEVQAMGPEGLVPVLDVRLYGRVSTASILRLPNEPRDVLFISTERYQFALLVYDAERGEIKTKATGSLKETIGKPIESTHLGAADPQSRMIALHLYEGSLKLLPFSPSGKAQEPFSVRVEESNLLSLTFLHGAPKPTLAVLYADHRQSRHVKTYSLSPREREVTAGPWVQMNVERGANLLIPVPAPLGGVLIVGAQTLTYHNGRAFKAIPIHTTCMCAWGAVDENGSRFLLGDTLGQLFLLVLNHDGQEVASLHLEVLGETSCASTLSYLDNGLVFVGSASGDSQLVRLNTERDTAGSYLSVEASYLNIAPILDMCLLAESNTRSNGTGQLVTCSGTYKDGSLRVIRNGIGIQEQAAIDLPGIKGLWSIRPSSSSPYDKYLVQAFISETRILGIDGEEMEEVALPGFLQTGKTLCVSNMQGDMLLQVTETSARLLDLTTPSLPSSLLSEWVSAQGSRVTVAAANSSQVVLGLTGGEVVYLELNTSQKTLEEKSRTRLEHEVSCLSVHPLQQQPQQQQSEQSELREAGGEDGMKVEGNAETAAAPSSASLVAVGMWTDMSVRLLSLPTLEGRHRCELGGDTQARSVLLTTFQDDHHYLLVGLGDGQLASYPLAFTGDQLSLGPRKKVSLGTQPLSLTPFSSHSSSSPSLCVFASSDRPTVIYSSNGEKLLFSNVNTPEVTLMAPFHSPLFPDCLALASEGGLRIGTVDDIQKLQVQTVPLGESPRRIAHSPQAGVLGVLTAKYTVGDSGEEETNYIRFLDDCTFEAVGAFELRPLELACSIVSCTLAKDPREYLVVGTCMALEDEEEPREGRLLVFHVSRGGGEGAGGGGEEEGGGGGMGGGRDIQLVAEKATKGAVYCLTPFNDKLLAGINSKVQLYRWADKDGSPELQTECGHHGHIMCLFLQSRGDFIVVGDLIRSISLLLYKPIDGTIEEIAKDYNPLWMTAVDMLDDDTFLGAEDHYNLFTVRKNSEAPSDEERYRLQTVGQYHLGEFVNKFVRGSLVVQPREGEKEGGTSSIEKAEKDGQIEGASTPSKAGGGKEGGRERGVSSTTAGGSGTGLLFGTQQGMVGSILPLSEEDYRFFRALTKAINKVVKGVGGFSHDEYRRFLTEKTVSDAHSFIDGDLIESFLDLSKQGMEEVVMLMRAEGVGGEGGGGVRGKKKGEEEEGVAGGKDVGGMEVVEEDQGGGKEAGREAGKQEGGLLMVEEVYRRVEDMMRLH